MAVTVSLYNHTARLFADGTANSGATFQVILCTAATFDATDEALGDVTYTEVANGDGYTTGGETLANVTVSTVTTNDASFDADDVSWTASGGPIAADYAILYLADGIDDPPLAFIDFDGTESAGDGTDFLLVWNASGIFTWTVA